VAIVGIGYVGLPTMIALANAKFHVTGIDLNEERVRQINAGQSFIEDVKDSTLDALVKSGNIDASYNYDILQDIDVIVICVPTPLNKNKEPDLGAIESTVANMVPYVLGSPKLIILQSTTYPGTTEEIILPKLVSLGLNAGEDFFLAFSPERIDPGNTDYHVDNVPKVVGGVTAECTELATSFLSTFIDSVVPVSSPSVAEMTKLLENIFRSVNIALVNELMVLSQRMGIDIWEVINAAATKPFGYMPFYPGPGVGGHCIPVDPFYLSWKAREHDFYVNFIQTAAQINDNMPYYVVTRIADILSDHHKPLNGSRLLLLGMTFKKDIGDVRNSPSVRVAELLIQRGVELSYHDNYAAEIMLNGETHSNVNLDDAMLKQYDAVILLVGHSYYDLQGIIKNSPLIVDTRNVAGTLGPHPNVVKI
jgi:UDP-N-acetyl-D-glucosamine dehydrogenase